MSFMKYNDPSKGEIEFETVEGVAMPKSIMDIFLRGKPYKEHMYDIKNLAMRDDDIIVCAYSKSGTHWVWEIINVLMTGKMNKKPKETSMLEFVPSEIIDEQPSPRILNTHNPTHLLPREIKEKKKTKIVYIYRNPKSVAVSAYYHFDKVATQMIDANIGDIASFIQLFPQTTFPYNYFQYLKEFDHFLKANPDIPSITLTYEDLKHNPEDNVKELAKFLGVDATDADIRHAIETCSFDNMKKADAVYKEKMHGEAGPGEESFVYRKGTVGDWKNHFTVADSEAYDTVIENRLADLDIKFTFT